MLVLCMPGVGPRKTSRLDLLSGWHSLMDLSHSVTRTLLPTEHLVLGAGYSWEQNQLRPPFWSSFLCYVMVSMARKGRQAVLERHCYFNQLAEPKGTATSNPIYMDQASHFQKTNRMKDRAGLCHWAPVVSCYVRNIFNLKCKGWELWAWF